MCHTAIQNVLRKTLTSHVHRIQIKCERKWKKSTNFPNWMKYGNSTLNDTDEEFSVLNFFFNWRSCVYPSVLMPFHQYHVCVSRPPWGHSFRLLWRQKQYCSSELLVKIYHITTVRRHITEHGNLLRPTLKNFSLLASLLKFIGVNSLYCEVRYNEDC
jgi:hypothetical protein